MKQVEGLVECAQVPNDQQAFTPIRATVTEPVVPGLRLLSSARLCAFPVVLPSFGSNSLFRPSEANISYVYIPVYLSLYNNPVLRLSLGLYFLSLSLSSPFPSLVLSGLLEPRKRLHQVLGTLRFP